MVINFKSKQKDTKNKKINIGLKETALKETKSSTNLTKPKSDSDFEHNDHKNPKKKIGLNTSISEK